MNLTGVETFHTFLPFYAKKAEKLVFGLKPNQILGTWRNFWYQKNVVNLKEILFNFFLGKIVGCRDISYTGSSLIYNERFLGI